MYVSKFLALNLELDPPDYSNLGENPEDVSCVLNELMCLCLGQNRRIFRLPDIKLIAVKLPRLDCSPRGIATPTCYVVKDHPKEPGPELSPQTRVITSSDKTKG